MNPFPEIFYWFYGQMELIIIREIKRMEGLKKMNLAPAPRLNLNRPSLRPMRSVNRNS